MRALRTARAPTRASTALAASRWTRPVTSWLWTCGTTPCAACPRPARSARWPATGRRASQTGRAKPQAANDEIVVADTHNHAIRVFTPGGAVRTLAGNGEAGFADGQGAAARFNRPRGLARDKDGSILVADTDNNAVRRVEGAVSTVAGNGEAGYADGEGAAARVKCPTAVVVDKEGTILVTDSGNKRLRKIVGRQVTTLAGGSEGTADGARFEKPYALALDERGRLLVAEADRADTLRVVDASLAPPAWMGPAEAAAEAAAEAHEEKAQQIEQLLGDYGKLVKDGELADGVFVVEGERCPLHRSMLAARSEYFGSLQVGDAGGGLQGGELRGRECLSVPVAAAVPLRGRAPGVGRAGTGAGTGTGAGSEGRVGRDGEPAGARVLGARARAARAKGAKRARTAMGARRGRGRGGAGELSAGAAAGGGPVPGEGRGGCGAGAICLGFFVPSPNGCMRAWRWVVMLSSLKAAEVGQRAAWCVCASRC